LFLVDIHVIFKKNTGNHKILNKCCFGTLYTIIRKRKRSRYFCDRLGLNSIDINQRLSLSLMNRNLVGSTYGRFCIEFPQSRMKGERHRLRLSLWFIAIVIEDLP
jgi:hypothetical protein